MILMTLKAYFYCLIVFFVAQFSHDSFSFRLGTPCRLSYGEIIISCFNDNVFYDKAIVSVRKIFSSIINSFLEMGNFVKICVKMRSLTLFNVHQSFQGFQFQLNVKFCLHNVSSLLIFLVELTHSPMSTDTSSSVSEKFSKWTRRTVNQNLH